MKKKTIKSTLLLLLITLCGFTYAEAQSGSSCFSKTGSLAANIQVFYADKIDEPIVFDASNSTGVGDFFKEPIEWDFGDGFKAKMCRSTHAYRSPGTYTVTLKVKNNQGSISTSTTTVTVADIPAATGNNVLTVVTNGSGNGTTTFNTIQGAIDRAALINNTGTVEIIVPAGVTFSENIELKVPAGNNYITLKSSALGNLPRGERVDRNDLANVATIKSPLNSANLPVLRTQLKNSSGGVCTTTQTCLPVHHYRLQGIQFMVDPGTLNGIYEAIVQIGTDEGPQNEASEQPYNVIIDRCLIYREDYSATNPTPQLVKNGFESHLKRMSIMDSHISGINAPGVESHAMATHNSTGTWSVINNYFESGGIPFIVGGATPLIPSARVEDAEFRRNRFHKPLEKKELPYAQRWSAKNNFESKNGRYWVIDENLIDGTWIGADQNYLVTLNALAQDTGENTTNQDFQFSNNVIKQGPGGFLIGRIPDANSPFPGRLLIYNNLIAELGGANYGTPSHCQADCLPVSQGQGFIITTVYSDMIFRHNTLLVRNAIMTVEGDSNKPILFQDNITNHGGVVLDDELGYGIKGGGTNRGCFTIDPLLPGCTAVSSTDPFYLGGSVFSKNVITGVPYVSAYPSNPNYPGNNAPYPYQSDNYYFTTQTPSNLTGFANIDNHFVNRSAGNYRIANGTPGKNGASDGLDVGADIDKTDTVSTNAVSGVWGATQTPYPGPNTPGLLSTIEVENYDNGGAGVAYFDLTAGNDGSGTPPVYRSNDVDTYPYANASNGQVVNSAQAGEWLEYTVNVPAAGLYNFAVRYSSGYTLANSKGKFRVEVCDPTAGGGYTNCVISPDVAVYATGGWGTFQTVNTPLRIPASGTKVLRLVMRTNAPGDTNCNCVVANFDAITVTNERSLFDFDNDRKADISLFRPSNSTWYLLQSTNGFGAVQFGVSTDTVASADYDGDGKTDIAVYRASTNTWWILRSSNLSVVAVQFGAAGDLPVQGDYTGDGKADIAVWRPSTGDWLILRSEDSSFYSIPFGTSGDIPAPGDYDGDGKFDQAVFRPSTGNWYLQQSLGGFVGVPFGQNGDKVTPADYDGDGKTDVAVFRPSTNTWWTLNSATLQTSASTFGSSGDIPAPADFDGDGKADIAVFRPSDGSWYLSQSTNGFLGVAFGTNGDVPAPSTYVR